MTLFRRTGLFCLPDVVGKSEESLILRPDCEVSSEEASSKPVSPPTPRPKDENTEPEMAPPPAPVPIPVQPGQPIYPPYFEGAPFPQPMWVRHTYNQWVPQPPPRLIKRKKDGVENLEGWPWAQSDWDPRQVLCEKCKNTLNSDEEGKDGPTVPKTSRKENAVQADEDAKATPAKRKDDGENDNNKESKRREESTVCDSKRFRKDKKDDEKIPKRDVVPHSPVIKISYSTPQGKGEVIKIPSRVHGSVKPFCPKQLLQNGHGEQNASKESQKVVQTPVDAIRTGLTISIPKLKLPKLSNPDAPSPKIRLRSRADGAEQVSVYEAELVDGVRRKSQAQSEDGAEKNSLELWSGEERDLTLLINFRKRKADSSSLSVCSSDSLDESKSFSSDGTSPEICDLAPGDDISVSSSSQGQSKTVPPITVRLHTRSMTKCMTEEGHAVTVGDVVWGKIHGFPWWPARVLSISGIRKEDGEVDAPWPEAKVSWFGSPTTSQLSVAKLSPFREFFRSRFNRKRKGCTGVPSWRLPRRWGHMGAEITTLLAHCET